LPCGSSIRGDSEEQPGELPISAELVARTRELMTQPIPAHVGGVARHCLIDWTGVTIAGAGEPVVECLVEEAIDRGGEADCSLIGRPESLSMLDAVTVNGAASHVLDFDDSLSAMTGHASVAIIPALFSLCESRPSQAHRLLPALISGHQMAGLLGETLGPAAYRRGFHSTATLGAMAAAVACSHFLGFDERRMLMALSVAASQAAGLKVMFGTMGKAFQVGRAAAAGLLAARLAAAGFDAPGDPIGHRQGFAAAHGDGHRIEPSAVRTDHYFIEETLFKYNAACFGVQAPVLATSALVRAKRIDPRMIESVRVEVAEDLGAVCNIERPATGLEAKFSIRATTAMAALGIDLSAPGAFSDAMLRSEDVDAMIERTEVVLDPLRSGARAGVVVRTFEGMTGAMDWDAAQPNPDLADQDARLEAKFLALTTPKLGRDRANELLDVIRRDDLDIAAYARLTRSA